MNNQQAFTNGFIKRASEYGINEITARNLVKQAVGMFMPAPPENIHNLGAGTQQAYANPLTSSPTNPGWTADTHQLARGFANPGQPAFPAPAAAPAPVAPQQPTADHLAAFRKATGSTFNAKSKMDWENMQRVMSGAGQLGTLSHNQWRNAGAPVPKANPLV